MKKGLYRLGRILARRLLRIHRLRKFLFAIASDPGARSALLGVSESRRLQADHESILRSREFPSGGTVSVSGPTAAMPHVCSQSSCLRGALTSVVVIAFTDRHPCVEALVSAYLNDEEVSVAVCLVGSPTDQAFVESLQDRFGCSLVAGIGEFATLGQKWQSAVLLAKQEFPSCQSICISGSDDYVLPSWLKAFGCLSRRYQGLAMVGFDSWFVLELAPDNSVVDALTVSYHEDTYFEPLGAGRVYSREFLDAVDWHIFDGTKDRLLDDMGWEKASQDLFRCRTMGASASGYVVSLKGPWDALNSLDVMRESPGIRMEQSSSAWELLHSLPKELQHFLRLSGPKARRSWIG